MEYEAWTATYGLPLGTFAYMVIGGFIPLFNAELYMVWVGTDAPRAQLPVIVAVAVAGQMTAKSVIYWTGRGAIGLPLGHYQQRIQYWQRRVYAHNLGLLSLVLLSAAAGWPPLYATSFLAGAMLMTFRLFVAVGVIGRALRFGVLAYAPGLVEGWIPAVY